MYCNFKIAIILIYLVDTPLHLCLKARNKDIFKLLLQNNADLKKKNKENISPLDLIEKDPEFKMILNEMVIFLF